MPPKSKPLVAVSTQLDTFDNWLKVGQYYFVKPPTFIVDESGTVIECRYGAFDMVYKNDEEGYAIIAKGKWPPKQACIPYGGLGDLLSEEESAKIYRNNIPKYGGRSRTHYWVKYETGNGPDDWQHLDAHPRYARQLGYPENCCWPGSRINTAERSGKTENCTLERLDYRGLNFSQADMEKIPKYAYCNGPAVFNVTTTQINEGDELLTRYHWTKNALTRFIRAEVIAPTGRRKRPKSGFVLPEGDMPTSESEAMRDEQINHAADATDSSSTPIVAIQNLTISKRKRTISIDTNTFLLTESKSRAGKKKKSSGVTHGNSNQSAAEEFQSEQTAASALLNLQSSPQKSILPLTPSVPTPPPLSIIIPTPVTTTPSGLPTNVSIPAPNTNTLLPQQQNANAIVGLRQMIANLEREIAEFFPESSSADQSFVSIIDAGTDRIADALLNTHHYSDDVVSLLTSMAVVLRDMKNLQSHLYYVAL